MNAAKQEKIFLKVIPIMLAFFAMGFVDLVGIATNYVKADFDLSDTVANLFPSMVFFWFLIFSVPTGMLMNKIGRRKTVLLSLVVTAVALLVPVLNYSFASMLVSFSLLGIGNTLMQVSINPLLSNIVKGEKLASSLTLGQFVKAIASFIAPLIAAWAAATLGDWKLLFPIFMAVAVLATLWLGITQIKEEETDAKTSTFLQCFALLSDKTILLSFFGIMCHVGIDVGVNVTAPKILIERLGMPLTDAGFATSLYFLFRTIGCFTGAFVLARYSAKKFFAISVALMVLSMAGLFVFNSLTLIYISIGLVGLGNSNIFPIILSKAMLYLPEKKNEVSGLMIMGLFGGTIFPLLMGFLSDTMASQTGALIVLTAGVISLIFLTFKLQKG
ncbi:MAG: MFS transporter [Proteiniphilum sp.]|jgi:fucose permease|uniref:MFS transporter n=1 Tax=Proteiniphilum sp. TaxID=1926877 RepID=UPI002B214E35|nr:MFS transporter [Proteiniphilum sp.]MEA5128791.1 MFS transporter [Proteiniphilum sp.]